MEPWESPGGHLSQRMLRTYSFVNLLLAQLVEAIGHLLLQEDEGNVDGVVEGAISKGSGYSGRRSYMISSSIGFSLQ